MSEARNSKTESGAPITRYIGPPTAGLPTFNHPHHASTFAYILSSAQMNRPTLGCRKVPEQGGEHKPDAKGNAARAILWGVEKGVFLERWKAVEVGRLFFGAHGVKEG